MTRPATRFRSALAALALAGCGAVPDARAPVGGSSAAPAAAPDAPGPRLVPCSDAPESEACGRAPAASPAVAAADVDPKNDDAIWRVTLGRDDPVHGPIDALVTIVIFSDFECPFCREAAEVLDQVKAAHPSDVRLVWKDLPLSQHTRAAPCAELARVARASRGDAGFWAVHDAIYASQPQLDDARLERIARQAGVDWAEASRAMRETRHASLFAASTRLADELAVDVAPTAFVNGRRMRGTKTVDEYEAVVVTELARARALVEKGTPRARVYEAAIAGGKHVAVP